MTFDENLEKELMEHVSDDPLEMIIHIVLSLAEYVFENGSGFAKELYISQLSINDNYITRTDRPLYRFTLYYVQKAQNNGLLVSSASAETITDHMLRICRGTIIDWCFHDYKYDLLKQTESDLRLNLKLFQTK